MKKIESAQISVVIQGPLYRELGPERGIHTCIASIRKILPDAEIIVSTWPCEGVQDVLADKIILSEDPGTIRDITGNPINTNRMTTSTLTGIEAAARPYVLKFRADLCLEDSSFAVIDEYHPEHAGQRLFNSPVTVTSLFIRNPRRCPMLWHISDLCQFGTRADMLNFWRQPMFEEQDLLNPKPCRNPFGNFVGYSRMKMSSEQILMINFMRRRGLEVDYLQNPCKVTPSGLHHWESVLSGDFRVLDWQTSGINFPGRFLRSDYSIETVYSAQEVQELRAQTEAAKKKRTLLIWLNQFIFQCKSRRWWLATASIALFSMSPSIAISARRHWRRARGIQHPCPEKW